MAVVDALCGSAERQGRIAFIDLYRQWPSYFLDAFSAVQAGDLRQAGHTVAWFKAFILGEDLHAFEALEEEMRSQGPWDLLVLERVWSHTLLARLVTASGGAEVVVTPWQAPASWSEVSFRIAPPNRDALIQLVQARIANDTPAIQNLYTRDDAGNWVSPPSSRALSIHEQFQGPLDFAYDAVQTFGLPQRETAKTRYLMLNMGCPYRSAPNSSDFLAGLELPTAWGDAGCTFCNVGPYEAQTAADRRSLMIRQLDALAIHGDYERLVVIDEFIFRDLEVLAEVLVDRAPPGVELLVRARVDYLETYLDALISALKLLTGRASITPYLVGFENFSDEELKRYNKGQSADQTMRAAELLITLADTWPNLNLSPSQGFILFGPWTTLSDLRANAQALATTNFRALRGGITRSKLRLNPDAALVARARADGLLVEQHIRPDEDNAAETGYQAEIPYRFQDPQTEHVWRLLNGPSPIRGSSELDRLVQAIALAEQI